MGTTLCNINLYNPEKVQYDVGQNYFVAHIAEDWDTILEIDNEHDFDRIGKLAKSLSKLLDTNAVLTIYFDDDIFELNVYSSGKVKAFYRNGYDGIFTKNTSHMTGILELDNVEAKAFRFLLKKEMGASDAIDKLSAICGLPFYVDKILFDEVPDKLVPDKEPVLREIETEKEKNQKTKKKNNKAELLCEIPGIFLNREIDYGDGKNGIIRVIEPAGGEVDYSHVNCYRLINEASPSLKKIHEFFYPFDEWAPGEKPRLLANFIKTLLVFDDQGCGVCELEKKEEMDNAISLGQIPSELLGEKEFEPSAFDYVLAEDLPENPGNIDKFAEDIRYSFFVKDHSKVKIENGYIVRLAEYKAYDKNEQFIVVDFFNESKEHLRTELIPIDNEFNFFMLNGDHCYIEEKQQIIFCEHIIDLNNKTFDVSDTIPAKMEYIARKTLKDGQEVLVVQSGKTIMVFDMDYKLLNSASVKHRIIEKMYDHEDNMLVVTATNTLGNGYKLEYKDGDIVSLYRIPLLPKK